MELVPFPFLTEPLDNALKLAELEGFNQLPAGADINALEIEYNRLFVGPSHVLCPPYESVYRKDRPLMERGLVMGPSVVDVKRMYLQGDLEISKKFRDLPDHISVELEFMAYLCSRETLNKKLVDVQREFFIKHLGIWYLDFLNCVMVNSKSPFYLMPAHELEEFLNEERLRFSEKD